LVDVEINILTFNSDIAGIMDHSPVLRPCYWSIDARCFQLGLDLQVEAVPEANSNSTFHTILVIDFFRYSGILPWLHPCS
jgi:hypothetical protein